MEEGQIQFIANYADWKAIKKITITEKTDPRTVAEFLAGLTMSVDNKIEANLKKIVDLDKVDKAIIEDLTTEAKQGLNLCRSSLKNISNIRKYYDISLSSKLNRIITVLTVFTIIISIPAAISGVYGMNVLLPLQENRFAFYIILGPTAFICLLFIWYLKKKKII